MFGFSIGAADAVNPSHPAAVHNSPIQLFILPSKDWKSPPENPKVSTMGELHCKLVPNARKSEILGWEEDPGGRPLLKIRLAAPALEGKANRALISFLSEILDTPKGKIELVQGEKSRTKRLRFETLGAEELHARVNRILNGGG
jgi:uncharacterized protein